MPLSDEQLKQTLKEFKAYHLKLFSEILRETLNHFGSLQALNDCRILELGPGGKRNMLRFFQQEASPKEVRGIGRMPGRLGAKNKDENIKLSNTFLLPALRSFKSQSYQLIYSRHVLEEHSINPLVLLSSSVYWRAIKENRIKNPDKYFPSSRANILAVLKEAFRVLKPGGLLLAQVAKDKNCPINEAVMKPLSIRKYRKRKLDRLSALWIISK